MIDPREIPAFWGLPDVIHDSAYREIARWAGYDDPARAAIVHDLMRNDTRWPKLLGDYVFFEAMGVDSVPLGWRLICFAAVLINFRRD